MIITSEINLQDFEGWSGAESTLAMLSCSQINTLQSILEDTYPDGIDETHLNDILRFETDWIAELLGFTDWESLERYEKYGDTVKVKIFNIEWDMDEDDDAVLPTEIVNEFDYKGDNDELEETITDWLTDEYEYCHYGFDYEIMCQGKERLEYFYKDYTKRKDSLSNKEKDIYRDMKIVQEMYARGFEFTPIDIYTASPDRFQIVDGKLMPALNTIEGMGDNAAIAVAEAAKDGKFLSKDDFRIRTKATKTVIDLMGDLGLLGDLPESNQLSLFDFA